MFRRSRSAPALLALLASLLIAAPVAAQSGPSAQREGAEEILEQAQRLEDGRGVRSGRELSVVLVQLAAKRSDLSRSDREEADRLLGRPTDPGDGGIGGPYSASARVLKTCSASFCVHWVDSTADAPPLVNANSCAAPDYVDHALTALEQSRDVENVQLGWRDPVSDGTRGGDDRTDVYLKQLNEDDGGLYGYAATDGGSGRARPAFMVLDDDYAASEFPAYGGSYELPAEVTAAHEYNHVLQYAYDISQDAWMYESTATWAEEKVFEGDDDYHAYMDTWAGNPAQPLTSASGLKMYGSAIWNHWLDQRYGADVVRRAWEQSVASGGFAPDAYDLAITDEPTGTSFGEDFGDFAAATAAWEGADSGIREAEKFTSGDPPEQLDVARLTPNLTVGTTNRPVIVDHTGFALVDVSAPGTSALRLSVSQDVPGATASIALVALDGTDVTKVVGRADGSGNASVTLPANTGGYERITAMVANADITTSGFDNDPDVEDWIWARDRQTMRISVAVPASPAPSEPVEEPLAPTATTPTSDATCGTTTVEREPPVATPTPAPTQPPTPIVPPTVTPTPTIEPPVATSVRLTRNSSRISSVLRKGVLSLFARTSKAGGLSARATVDRKTARRLRVGRRTTTVGRGRRTATAPARLKVNVKLTRKLRNALKRKRNRKRSLKIKVVVTFTPVDGTAADRDTIVIKLRP